MATFAQIVHTWPDGSVTDLEVGTDELPHPDLLDSLVGRVLELYRETVAAGDES